MVPLHANHSAPPQAAVDDDGLSIVEDDSVPFGALWKLEFKRLKNQGLPVGFPILPDMENIYGCPSLAVALQLLVNEPELRAHV